MDLYLNATNDPRWRYFINLVSLSCTVETFEFAVSIVLPLFPTSWYNCFSLYLTLLVKKNWWNFGFFFFSNMPQDMALLVIS